MTDTIFRTGVFSKKIRILLLNRKGLVSREEPYAVFGRDKKTKKRIYSAVSNLRAQGHVEITPEGYRYISEEPLPGDKADRIWKYWRSEATFTAHRTALFTEISRPYIQSLIRHYIRLGFVELVPLRYSNTDSRVYRLKDPSIIIRPTTEK
ncbi:MAG: hypothetical protein HQ557_17635 [Bacteroidetes bacterium]|nr:hypothetical protein [Bacteroidota bacterium]